MNPFTVRTRTVRKNPFILCGRMFLDNDTLRIGIDGRGCSAISIADTRTVILGLGESPITGPDGGIAGAAWLSESGKGLYCSIGNRVYVTPVQRVKMVLSGKHRKAPVFERITETKSEMDVSFSLSEPKEMESCGV
ncbi:hypothetical protein [Methanospirillum sp.]|uniref:hypothetical protein n=1 Tax=Methanospirillum sp. TaxID=45200 RepID=UPI002CB66F8B|nr:hypothetical protein [Methanospirillum sp.]HPP78245.1 hypothetical protein [Methanospirillum sp.]